MKMDGVQQMFGEVVLMTRLKFVAFKRLVAMYESLLFLIGMLLLLYADLPTNLNWCIVALALLRVVTELLNYHYVAQVHNVHDPWRLLFPFGFVA